MNQELGLSPRSCARNAGTFLLIRLSFGSIIYLALNSVFPVPSYEMVGAISNIKTNSLLFTGLLAALFFMGLFSLIVAFPLNNVLTSIDEDGSKRAQKARLAELFFFIVGMGLLIFENPNSIQILFVSFVFYVIYMILNGYLVFVSGYLSKVLGISMILGGITGFLTITITLYQMPGLIWLSTIGGLCVVIPEVAMAFTFLIKALRIEITDPKETITMILKEFGEATTAEIMDQSSKVSAECKDRIPEALVFLESEGKVAKKLSKEKRGYVWSLVS
ncbi:MAG: hypothetical protein EAX87_01160 [Candidatus Thorarchaeota archaeon]|nr:hypothetical protein [Candidatus Thorarchaeota archaeon]